MQNNLRRRRSVVGSHVLDDHLEDVLLLALGEGVGEDLDGEVTDDTLEDGLIGGDASLLEGRNLLSNPGDQAELGTRREIISSLNADELQREEGSVRDFVPS